MPHPLLGKHILLGVTGSIAAYKAADLASKLTQAGAVLDVVLTEGAQHFVTPLTFQSVTGRKAYTDQDLWGGEGHVTHIGLGRAAQMVVVAPASANTLARLANGLGDTLLTVAVLASHCPLVLAPAMDVGMFEHPATQANVERLVERGALLIGPAEGRLASGLTGRGRMVEPGEILAALRYLAGRGGPLAGRRVVVTAGGTQEPLDPVRVLTNRSSGKQGFALAQAALDAGADVTLIAAPTALSLPYGVRHVAVRTAAQMAEAVLAEVAQADALLMAAAVADFRPAQVATQKIKKEGGLPTLVLEPTSDILAAVGQQRLQTGWPHCLVGFAAESRAVLENAQAKLQAKHLDLIVANDILATDAGFEVDANRVVLLFADGSRRELPLMSKAEVAEQVLGEVIRRCAS